jgi:hypothetical protein
MNMTLKITIHIYCLIWVQFGTEDLNIMLLNKCELSGKSVQEKRYFSSRSKPNYINPCTGKPHDILKAKNFLVKSVYCVTERTVCSLGLDSAAGTGQPASQPTHGSPVLERSVKKMNA